MVAEVKDDKVELRLIEHVTPRNLYAWADTTLPVMLLDMLSLTHVGEQLDRAAMVANAMFCSALEPDDYYWEFIGKANAYFFKIGQEGWQQFAQGLGLDAKMMIERNHHGTMLSVYSQKICDLAPSADELKAILAMSATPWKRSSQPKMWPRAGVTNSCRCLRNRRSRENRHEKTPAGAGVQKDFGDGFTTPEQTSRVRSF